MPLRPLSLRAAFVVATIACALGGCGQTQVSPSMRADSPNLAQDMGFARFSDIPVPKGADMDIDRTLVLGNREAWVGRLVMHVSDTTGAMYDFYARQMPGFGWQPVTSVRGAVSVLTFTRGERVATVQLQSRTLFGSEVWLTVSPHGDAAPGLAPSMSGPLPGGHADNSVEVRPLR
jgi:hypothetical protein